MALSKLQRNVYNMLLEVVDPNKFNTEYNNFISTMNRKEIKYYDKKFVYGQGYFNGSPMSLDIDKIEKILSVAGYKDPKSDIAYTSFFKASDYIYKNVF